MITPFRTVVFASGLVAMLTGSVAADQAWVLPPAQYRYEPAPCPETGAPSRIYRPCEDQMAMFAAGLATARREGRLLLVEFGANWCPNCRATHKQLAASGAESVVGPGSKLYKSFHVIGIATSMVGRGRMQPVPSGEAVLKLLQQASPDSKLRAIPLLAFVDPARVGKVFFRHVDDLVPRGEVAPDPVRLSAMLAAAAGHVRDGSPAPTEPGWLRRKLQKVWPDL